MQTQLMQKYRFDNKSQYLKERLLLIILALSFIYIFRNVEIFYGTTISRVSDCWLFYTFKLAI